MTKNDQEFKYSRTKLKAFTTNKPLWAFLDDLYRNQRSSVRSFLWSCSHRFISVVDRPHNHYRGRHRLGYGELFGNEKKHSIRKRHLKSGRMNTLIAARR